MGGIFAGCHRFGLYYVFVAMALWPGFNRHGKGRFLGVLYRPVHVSCGCGSLGGHGGLTLLHP